MSILIKGMEMPTDGCKDCIFVNRKWHGDICPILKREVSGNVERGGFQTDCPLVPVPPHGRLIDANALEADTEWDDYEDGYISYSKIAIDCAPTIITAEEEQI